MKKREEEDELQAEYHLEDLGPRERGKHFAAYQQGTNLVLLEPKVAAAFPTAEAVNRALLSLIEQAGTIGKQKQVRGSAKAR